MPFADSPISISDIGVVVAIAASSYAVLNGLVGALISHLQAKIGSKREETVRQSQSEQCRFDHVNISSIIAAQNSNISKMLEQNGEMLLAIREAATAREVQHQIVLAELRAIAKQTANHRCSLGHGS